jgi:hypothetical protein
MFMSLFAIFRTRSSTRLPFQPFDRHYFLAKNFVYCFSGIACSRNASYESRDVTSKLPNVLLLLLLRRFRSLFFHITHWTTGSPQQPAHVRKSRLRALSHHGLCTKAPISSSINSRKRAQPINMHLLLSATSEYLQYHVAPSCCTSM